MGKKVTIEVTQGITKGQKYEYTAYERVFVGRQEDCAIVLPEKTVSRYHCVLEITPPEVKLQDFGSLNGTFLNSEKIGQRDREQSWEEAKEEKHDEFILHNGDELGLGSKCKLKCIIEKGETCANCGVELPDGVSGDETVPEGEEYTPVYHNDEGKRICPDCWAEIEKARLEKKIAEKKAKEEAEKEAARKADERARILAERKAERERKAAEKRKAEQEKKRAEEEARKEAEKKRLEEEARKAEEEKIRAAEAKKAEEEKRRAEEEARKAEEEKKRKEEEARKAEEEKKRAEEEARKAEEEKRRAEEEARKAEEEKRRAEEEAKKAEAERIEAEKQRAELEAQMAAANLKKKKCVACGKLFKPKADDNNLCPDCLSDKAKVVDAIILQMLGLQEPQKPLGPSPVEGYKKVKLLGKGGMGEVWKVQETKSGKYFALKTMLPEMKADDKAVKMFIRESSVGEALSHKNVVRTYKSGCANGTFYILMDLCEGGSVDDLVRKKGGKLSLELATWITLQVLSGLDYVHNVDIDVAIQKGLFRGTKEVSVKGVVHRDFKPGNIFLSDTSDHPVAMVADLGMAKAFETAGLSKDTKSGTIMGTPVFMPRQQAMNFKYSKPEVDVWAAAASYYFMLTGTFPKNFRPDKNVWQIIVTESAVPIRNRNSSIPMSIAKVIDKALTEIPKIGYSTAGEFRRDLVAALPADLRNAVKGVLK